MPRYPAPGNARGQEATRKWREGLAARSRPEVDAVDAALSAAVAAISHLARTQGGEKDRRRASGLERLAVNYLVSSGYSSAESERVVKRRLLRPDMEALLQRVGDRSHQTDVTPVPSSN